MTLKRYGRRFKLNEDSASLIQYGTLQIQVDSFTILQHRSHRVFARV